MYDVEAIDLSLCIFLFCLLKFSNVYANWCRCFLLQSHVGIPSFLSRQRKIQVTVYLELICYIIRYLFFFNLTKLEIYCILFSLWWSMLCYVTESLLSFIRGFNDTGGAGNGGWLARWCSKHCPWNSCRPQLKLLAISYFASEYLICYITIFY